LFFSEEESNGDEGVADGKEWLSTQWNMQDKEQGEVLAVRKQCETLKVRASGLNLQGRDKLSVPVKTAERVVTGNVDSLLLLCLMPDSVVSRT